MEKRKKEESGGAPEWMTTYSDLVTLLMAFFVLLFAFSEIDAQKFEAVMQSFQGSAGILSGGVTLSKAELVFQALPESNITETVEKVEENLQILKEVVEEFIEAEELVDIVSVEFDSRGLIIRFKDNALFDSGRADIRSDSHEILEYIGDILKTEEFVDRYIRVEGHTDNVPINTARFPSNWELSTTRATTVTRFFIDHAEMEPSRLAAAGYSENYPIAENETPEGRANNRRVDIVILSRFFENSEPTTEHNVEETGNE